MNKKHCHRVYPSDSVTILHSEVKFPMQTFLAFVNVAVMFIGGIWAIVNLFAGGYGWLICLIIVAIVTIILNVMSSEAETEMKTEKAKNQSDYYSDQLNEILDKSEEIVIDILPSLESSAKKSIDLAKVDFSENALSPFWDKIEEASKLLACYKQAVEQLIINGELYLKVLEGKQHNFPKPFPVGANISISQSVITDYNKTIRKAQSKFEFANIWEHRKTQIILIAGFQNLEQAISNMKDAIVESIYNLEQSIVSEFRDLKNIQIEQIKSYEACQTTINNTLTSMDTKLYYIQYKKRPITPFIRPVIE